MTESKEVIMNYSDLKRKANGFRQGKKYEEAITFYDNIWKYYRSECSEWDAWGYIYCLKQCKRYEEAIELCREARERWQGVQHIDNLYAWCLFFKEIINGNIEDEQQLISTVDLIIELSGKDFMYSPLKKTVLKAVRYLKER